MPYPQLTESETAKFWAKVDKSGPNGCWVWTGYCHASGYGHQMLYRNRKNTVLRCHRLSYELAGNEIPAGLHLLHSCDNPPCVNPQHLRAGTPADNMADCISRNRYVVTSMKGEINPRAKLTDDDVVAIRAMPATPENWKAAATKHGVSVTAVRFAAKGVTWRHLN